MSWSKLSYQLQELLAQIWVKVLAFAILGVATALIALLLRPVIPIWLTSRLGIDAVGVVLQIIASSMLAVTIFSLSTLVNAWTNAQQHATPRVLPLIVADGRSQTVLGTFIGAFVFSLVGIIMLQTGVYGGPGRVILFAATGVVVLLVIAALMQWIEILSDLGQIRDVLDRLERATAEAVEYRQTAPWLGGHRWSGDPPEGAEALLTEAVGRVRHVDAGTLQSIAEAHGLTIYLDGIPGSHAHAARPMLHVAGLPGPGEPREVLLRRLMGCFTIGATPSFEQDPLHGLSALAEVAQRALSPAINDPGTANEVIQRQLKLLTKAGPVAPGEEIRRPNLHVREITARDMMDAAFAPIARDAGAMMEVQCALMDAVLALTKLQPDFYRDSARRIADLVLYYAELKGIPDPMLAELRDRASAMNGL
ncbi:Uncharacterized membrane protein [Paracoccus isoporae]|uniref:Uncharacterized membrane protein n=1 Tax=Paracoccus isoporae TaxID=591205 RepID=A0A1G6SSS9_9RHOB|nr:DUF2254 domain-containing protein [Paracoccus isoporae]SDD19858.1 Uncharacterized membrane protein [Paracoccus isoporae]